MTQVDPARRVVRGKRLPPTPLDEAIQQRVRAVCQGIPYRVIAEITGFSEETIRRYLRGHKPAAAFLARICHAFELSPAWMLLAQDGPLERHAAASQFESAAGSPGVAGTLDEQLRELATHVAALRFEVDRAAARSDRPDQGAASKEPASDSAKQENNMMTQETRTLRLVLGPADGQKVEVERPQGEEIVIRLDAKHPRAQLVDPDKSLEPAAKVYRYRRVMPQVYRWINPAVDRE